MTEQQRNGLISPPKCPNDMVTWIVAGHPRSGTSMMMEALIAGGMDAVYSAELDNLEPGFGNKRNPISFFELGAEYHRDAFFPANLWGKLFKLQFSQLFGLTPGRYRIAFMLRRPQEIRASFAAMGGQSLESLSSVWHEPEHYYSMMGRALAIMAARSDVLSTTRLWYHEVIANPQREFSRLSEDGFVFDVQKATEVVKPEWYRQRLPEP